LEVAKVAEATKVAKVEGRRSKVEGRRSKIEGCGGCGGYRESVGRIYVVGMSGVEKSLKSEIEIYAVEGDCGNCLVR